MITNFNVMYPCSRNYTNINGFIRVRVLLHTHKLGISDCVITVILFTYISDSDIQKQFINKSYVPLHFSENDLMLYEYNILKSRFKLQVKCNQFR